MKVVHILYSLKFSGAEIMYVDAAKLFQEKGCDLTVVATAPTLGEFAPFFDKAGYRVLHMPYPELKRYFSRIRFFITFFNFLKKEDFDIVHIHLFSAMWGIALCAWLAKIKAIYTIHNSIRSRAMSYHYHYILRWSAKYIFKCRFHSISDSVHEHELKLYHNSTKKIYNWFNSNRFYPASKSEKDFVREILGIKKGSLVIISIGGCSDVKRHSEIIRALPYILKKIPECVYLHLGNGVSELKEIELAYSLGVEKYVRFCRNQSDVRKYLIVSDIYLMPSRFEGMPITTIEAMACKIPSILYDVPGLHDFNKDAQNSFLIPEDYISLAETVIYLNDNINIANEVAMRAKTFVNRYYNMETNVEQIFELYNI